MTIFIVISHLPDFLYGYRHPDVCFSEFHYVGLSIIHSFVVDIRIKLRVNRWISTFVAALCFPKQLHFLINVLIACFTLWTILGEKK